MNNIKEAIEKIENLRKEADRRADTAAAGYDAGYYCGEESAYAVVMEILKNIDEEEMKTC